MLPVGQRTMKCSWGTWSHWRPRKVSVQCWREANFECFEVCYFYTNGKKKKDIQASSLVNWHKRQYFQHPFHLSFQLRKWTLVSYELRLEATTRKLISLSVFQRRLGNSWPSGWAVSSFPFPFCQRIPFPLLPPFLAQIPLPVPTVFLGIECLSALFSQAFDGVKLFFCCRPYSYFVPSDSHLLLPRNVTTKV